jgi:WhiB family redox-sensing transcriptional regulator
MSTDRRIANRIRKGGTDRGIGRELRISPHVVARVRRGLDIPPFGSGRPANWPDLHTMIRALSEPTDGGHMRWTGHFKDSQPTALWKSHGHSVYRLAFTARWDREPEGYVRPGCGWPQCIAQDHLEDRAMRRAANNASAAPRARRHSTPRLAIKETPVTTDDWRHDALCKSDPELHFPTGNTGPHLLQIEEAKAMCRRCPSMKPCQAWALEQGEPDGVWGGLSEGERKSIRRRDARQRAKYAA